jgi:hypothetical protein
LENTHGGKENNKMNVNCITPAIYWTASLPLSLWPSRTSPQLRFSNTQRSTQKSLTAPITFTPMNGDKSTP